MIHPHYLMVFAVYEDWPIAARRCQERSFSGRDTGRSSLRRPGLTSEARAFLAVTLAPNELPIV